MGGGGGVQYFLSFGDHEAAVKMILREFALGAQVLFTRIKVTAPTAPPKREALLDRGMIFFSQVSWAF